MNEFFQNQMKALLKNEYADFERSQHFVMFKGLRVNVSKGDIEEIKSEIEVGEKTPFDPNTYYLNDEDKIGNHPFHLAGLFYLQEPSATMPVNALDVKPGDMVLDLCASPGGKTTQILNRLNGEGFLLCNEISNKRAMNLLSNLERWGYENYLETNEPAEKICRMFYGVFDKVLIDAPCSGSAMFKKYPETLQQYDQNLVNRNVSRQREILQEGYQALKKGGTLVYSTCTYDLQENEENIADFLSQHPDMQLVDTGLSCGREGFETPGLDHNLVRRELPYRQGEGHFVAKMIRTSENNTAKLTYLPFSKDKLVDEFIRDNIQEKINYTIIRDQVYYSKNHLLQVNCHVVRQGILMGEIVKNRFEPAHQLYLSNELTFKKACDITDLNIINKYLSGESLMIPGYKGYTAISYKGHILGFGKGDGQQIKNKYPKGLRLLRRV